MEMAGQSADEATSEDITLVAEGESIPANKALLCKHSLYFSAMFRSNMKETDSKRITLHDVPPPVLRSLVRFCSRHSVHLTMCSVYDVLNAACMLQFTGVINACVKYLTQHLGADICLGVMFGASRNGLDRLYFRARRYALWNFSAVCEQPEFWQLPLEPLVDYLSEDMLEVDSERQVLDAVYKWLMYSSTDRVPLLPQALDAVRLGRLSEEELRQILREEFVMASPEAATLISRVMKCKMEPEDKELRKSLHENCFKERYIEKEIWMIGGELLYHDRKAPHTKIALFDEKTRKIYDIYDKLPPLVGHEREYLGYRACLVRKDLYLCGGEITMGRNCWQLKVWKFDTFEESWEVVGQLPQPRRHLALVAMDTDLYLIGGFGRHRIMLDSVDKYDTVTDDWSTAPCLNRAVYSAATCRLNDRIYIIKHDVESYSPGDVTWTKITMPLPFEIGIQTCVASPDRIYIIGSYIRDIIELDVQTLKLTKLGTFKNACGPAVLLNRVVYVLGGEDAETVESYSLDTGKFMVECKIKVALMAHSAAVVPCYPGYGRSAENNRPS